VDGTSGAIVRQPTEAERLGHDTLPRERRVAMQLNAEDAVAELALSGGRLEERHLLATRDAQRDGVDGLEVRWVLEHLDLDVLVAVLQVVDCREVRYDVAARARCCLGVELGRAAHLGEECSGVVPEQRWLGQEVEAATVRERNHDRRHAR
jgi:hypothetical protein